MKFLVLSGHGVKINVDSGKLHIQDGRTCVDKDPEKFTFKPKMCDYDNLVIYGHNGHITFEAMRWMTKNNLQLTLLDWNGRLLTNVLPIESKQTKLKFLQYQAYQSKERLSLAKNLIDAKIKNSITVLTWLKERYPEVNDKPKYTPVSRAKFVKEIMSSEASVASHYWIQITKIIDDKFEFTSRLNYKRPFGAVDPANALFNYGYALLESICHKAINTVGLDTHVGFMHEFNLGKTPLVYDLQEPFRCLIDLAIIKGLEKKIFKKEDFIRTTNYNVRLKPSGAEKLTKEIEAVFNNRIFYRGKNVKWDYVVTLKAQELSHYLLGKRKDIDFSDPELILDRIDNTELRDKINNMNWPEAKKLKISKGTLHYLRKNAKSDKPFKIYEKVKERLV